MSLLARTAIVLTLPMLIAIPGCSAPAPSPSPVSSAACEADGCNGREVTDIHCQDNATTIASLPEANVGKVRGMLEVRKANPSTCNRIYWAKFTPKGDNQGAWEVTLERNGKRTDPQKSEPKNPTVEGWSEVYHANTDDRLRACVRDAASGKEACIPAFNPS